MKAVLAIFASLAAIGTVLSVAIHLAVLTGIVDSLDGWIPLMLGIFIVWAPAVLAACYLSKGYARQDLWPAVLQGCPLSMIRILVFINRYVTFKFWLPFAAVLVFITFPNLAAGDLFGRLLGAAVTGVWVVFYFMSFAILYSAMMGKKSGPIGRCPAGHLIFCSGPCAMCGKAYEESNASPQPSELDQTHGIH